MADTCKTVRIVSTHPESQGPFVEINEEDFDKAVHTPYVDPLDHDGNGKKGGSRAEGDSFEGMTVPALKALAAERNVDLGDATKKADIIAALELAAEEAAKAEVVEPAAEAETGA